MERVEGVQRDFVIPDIRFVRFKFIGIYTRAGPSSRRTPDHATNLSVTFVQICPAKRFANYDKIIHISTNKLLVAFVHRIPLEIQL